MEELGDRTDILFVGGSAGDDLGFKATRVFADGCVYDDAAILLVMKPTKGFKVLKTQSFVTTGRTLTATSVDEGARMVMEFDGKPAVEAYAEALGVARDKVADRFMTNPLGLMVDGEPFVRSPQRMVGDSMAFFCNIKEGMTLSVLESGDMVRDTRADLIRVLGGMTPSAIINFNCILRTTKLIEQGLCGDYGAVFKGLNTVGFSTYGEEYLGHLNQTATMLVLG